MPALPSGTVTFLFTDVEGSTRLLERHPEAYRGAIARHHTIVCGAVEQNRGAVFETVGDAVYAAFASGRDAVAAALRAQHDLHEAPWGEVGALRVRMGLHTGEVERQGDHYFGAALYLRQAIGWSYDLLTPDEQKLLRRLAVFGGGCTLTAVEAVVRGGEPDTSLDVVNGMASLVDKSLLRQEETTGELRFRMLETIREYSLERLISAEEADRFQRAHAEYFLEFAEQAEPGLLGGPRQAEWLNRLMEDHDNLRAALAWFVPHEPADHGLRLGGALARFWQRRGHLAEGRDWTSAHLALPTARTRTAARAKALRAAGGFANQQGDYIQARAWIEESLNIYRELGNIHGIGWGLVSLGLLTRYEGDHVAARSLLEESLGLVKQTGDTEAMAAALGNLGLIARDLGDAALAESRLDQSLGVWRELGDRVGIGWTLAGLAMVARATGRMDVARARTDESLAIWRELGDRQNTANVLTTAARLASDPHVNFTPDHMFRFALGLRF